MNCRFDGKVLSHVFVDLGFSPPSNSFLTQKQLVEFEIYYPLKLYVSERTFLVQTDEFKKASEIFNDDYVYYSSYSLSWLKHCELYTNKVIPRFNLCKESLVVEIASNDGYLLQYFKNNGIPGLGIEPTANTAQAAQKKGIETIVDFFGVELANKLVKEGIGADLLIGNNVLAHVPNLNDFVKGLKILLKDTGVITMEFPHVLKLIEQNQFDTIYHEHFSYFSLYTTRLIFRHHGLEIFDVEEVSTHGGSLRIYARHTENNLFSIEDSVDKLIEIEKSGGLLNVNTYLNFNRNIEKVKLDLLEFLMNKKKEGKIVIGYGAAAKGNTLLNYCGIKPDLLKFVADLSPHKQNKYLPGSHIPVVSPDEIKKEKPDFILIFPWNIKNEIMDQLSDVRDWGAKFVIPIPKLIII